MRVTLLGTGSADGWPNPFCSCESCSAERAGGRARRPSSALVDGCVLLDCGPTTPHPAPGSCSLESVEHVLVTHGHPDHLHPAFLLSWRWTHPERTLHVWGPAQAIDLCRDWIGSDSHVHLHTITAGEVLTLPTFRGDYRIVAIPAHHAHGDGDALAAEALLFAITAPDDAHLLYATDTGPGFEEDVAGLTGHVAFDIVLIDETFGDRTDHRTGHLDLSTLPRVIDALRGNGAVAGHSAVFATHLSHHNPPTPELRHRLAAIGVRVAHDGQCIDSTGVGTRTLIVGGARSGKSHYAENALHEHGGVTYVATGGTRSDDPEWAERIAAHQARRPQDWVTVETADPIPVLREAGAGSAILVDCLSLWLTTALDDIDAWRRLEVGERSGVVDDAHARITCLVDAVRTSRADVVLVSNEVGMGVVPGSASGRLFRDLLGTLNAAVSAACDRTVLVVAGRAMTIHDAGPHG